jgi:predicted nucleic acid-binding protein
VAPIVVEFLAERFADPPLTRPARRYRDLLRAVAGGGITGGAVYDALIGMTASEAGATLLTRDPRAVAIYDRLEVRHELVV